MAFTEGTLVLNDGSFYFGRVFVPSSVSSFDALGELCFNTSITGGQEIVTDPSYAGQIIVFTFPYIGNTGYNSFDYASAGKGLCSGIVVREEVTDPSNHRAEGSFLDFLEEVGVIAIFGVDVRNLTSRVRVGRSGAGGVSNGMITTGISRHTDKAELASKVGVISFTKLCDEDVGTSDKDLASIASCGAVRHFKGTERDMNPYQMYALNDSDGRTLFGHGDELKGKKIVVLDFGAKEDICRLLHEFGFSVVVVNCMISYEDIAKHSPDAVLLSNGPGDPRATFGGVGGTILALIRNGVPLFGICLGYQLVSLALGCKIEKMSQGHRGVNHPVLNLLTNKVDITAQNHGFAVGAESIPSWVEVTHISLFDGVVQGVCLNAEHQESVTVFKQAIHPPSEKGFAPVRAVQYHPEASAGPHDALRVFKWFFSDLSGWCQS